MSLTTLSHSLTPHATALTKKWPILSSFTSFELSSSSSILKSLQRGGDGYGVRGEQGKRQAFEL